MSTNNIYQNLQIVLHQNLSFLVLFWHLSELPTRGRNFGPGSELSDECRPHPLGRLILFHQNFRPPNGTSDDYRAYIYPLDLCPNPRFFFPLSTAAPHSPLLNPRGELKFGPWNFSPKVCIGFPFIGSSIPLSFSFVSRGNISKVSIQNFPSPDLSM